MPDDMQRSQPTQTPATPASMSEAVVPASGKPNNRMWIIALSAVGALGVLCLCLVAAVAIGAGGIFMATTEKAPAESVLDAYMQAMAGREVETAYALLSPRAQRLIPISKLQELVEGNNYLLFEGYRSLSIENLSVRWITNINPDLPQGNVLSITGRTLYEDDIEGTFSATLEKLNGTWKIDGMNVIVPPAKMK